MRTILVSAAALIDKEGRVLLAERPQGKSMAGLWEFPGGKVEEGELPDIALARELKEELAIDVPQDHLNPLTFVSHEYEDFHLLMLLYWSRVWKGIPTAQEGQQLQWLRPKDMQDIPMPPADLPLIAVLRDFIG